MIAPRASSLLARLLIADERRTRRHHFHATIIRGIGRLEASMNTKLSDKLASGYRLTNAGSDIVELASQMATASSRIEARIFGRDQSVSGPLKFTLPVSFATDLANGVRREPGCATYAAGLAAAWLSAELAAELETVWSAGMWLPQEALGTEQLHYGAIGIEAAPTSGLNG